MDNDTLNYILCVVMPITVFIIGLFVKKVVCTRRKEKFLNSIKVGDILCDPEDLANPFQTDRQCCRKICEIRKGGDGLKWYDSVDCDKTGYSRFETHYQFNEKNYFFEHCIKLDN